jgi:hypothetical protein
VKACPGLDPADTGWREKTRQNKDLKIKIGEFRSDSIGTGF